MIIGTIPCKSTQSMNFTSWSIFAWKNLKKQLGLEKFWLPEKELRRLYVENLSLTKSAPKFRKTIGQAFALKSKRVYFSDYKITSFGPKIVLRNILKNWIISKLKKQTRFEFVARKPWVEKVYTNLLIWVSSVYFIFDVFPVLRTPFRN